MENEKKLIYAEDLFTVLRDDINISGANLARIKRHIANSPAVDAVEVAHGYWIDSYNADHIGRIIEHSIDCSVCDSVFKDDSRAVVKHWKEQFKVCPFCGAKMDGDGNG